MEIMRAKSKKGILLTLAVIVLVVLMVAELVAYVYLNASYQALDALGSSAAGTLQNRRNAQQQHGCLPAHEPLQRAQRAGRL